MGERTGLVGEGSLCVSDLCWLGLSERRALVECHVLKGEELIEIGARGRGVVFVPCLRNGKARDRHVE